ncbi:uncharacterized protein A4U43_C09F8400 [Asparagus officinalis]|uniref:Uncharacterized protein n=1 Tax=Asparagus officinalis TaxID=4686 RepID=A0A5P1E7Y1_ASPOF|nr:uncharacterized protein A4U43_C09F8400 [Asparagus officinalis]
MVPTAPPAQTWGGPLTRPRYPLDWPGRGLLLPRASTTQGDATSQPLAEILLPQAVKEATVAVANAILTEEAEVVIIDDRSLAKEEGADIYMAEAEDA